MSPAQLSVQSMTGLLTLPYRRGAETLELALGADGADGTTVAAYDFRDYRARYGADPSAPRYVLICKQAIGPDPLGIEVDYRFQGARQTAALTIPADTFAGTSFAIPLPAQADATLVLLRLRQRPVPLPGAGADRFGILALLGILAKLAWVLGWEKDLIRQQLHDARNQRRLAQAHGASLDRLGADLRVPRFPPRAHSFDPDTLALYHLDGFVADGGPVVDETARFGQTGHPGVNAGAQSLAIGKFGTGFRFPGAAGDGRIIIADHADFVIPAHRGFTVEAFVNAEADAAATPRMVALKGPVDATGTLSGAGWSLVLVGARGIAGNLRWAVSDGLQALEIFSDRAVADGRFHHLAGVLDRHHRRLRLYVDGEEHAGADASGLGVIASNVPILIGRSAAGHAFAGVIDELRLSGVARTDFHPVLGESDDAYRQRLGIFERWLLPTPDALARVINERVQIDGAADAFVLTERDPPGASTRTAIRIYPAALPSGQSIDRDGAMPANEAAASGTAADETDFDPLLLVTHAHPQVDYGADPDNRHMQAATRAALDALLALLAGVPDKLIVDKAFEPADAGLHATGRALLLRHPNRLPEQLAVLAYRAGFDFVRNAGLQVYASVAPGEKLVIELEPGPPNQAPPAGIDVLLGRTVDLDLTPAGLPAAGLVRWTLIPCGAGNAHFVAHPTDDPTLRMPVTARRRLRLVPDAPGTITVRVEYAFRGRVYTGTRTLRISLDSLADQVRIAADGTLGLSEAEAVGPPDTIDPIYLVDSNAAGVDYGADPDNHKMQLVLERPFNALLAGTPALAAGLRVLKAFDPAGPGLHPAGRALRLAHDTLVPERLGALAHRASFGFVQRQGAEIYCSAAADDKIEIAHAGSLAPLEDEQVTGTAVELRARFDVLPGAGSFNWSVVGSGQGTGEFDFVLRPQVRFTPRHPGTLVLSLDYLEADPAATRPYTFEIALKPTLEAANAIIPKHQYDLIMNILNYYHPIGVEVATGRIRKHVVEVEQDPQKAFPAYTYPDFRV